MFTKLSVAALFPIMLGFVSTAALAAPFFEATARVDAARLFPVVDAKTSTDGSPLNSHAAISASGRIGSADANVGGGLIGVRASAFAENNPILQTVEARAGGYFDVGIVTGSCVSGTACAATTTSINFSLGGSFLAESGGPVGANAEGSISVFIRLSGGGATLMQETGNAGAITIPGVGLMQWNNGTFGPPTGILSSYILNSSGFFFHTGDFLLEADSEYRLEVALSADSLANSRTNLQLGDHSDLAVDFSHTLTFGPGPVFNGSFDFSIESPDANIANNQWTDPRGTSTSVPEPAMVVLFGAGLALTGWMRRRRKMPVAA
jgi:hypothetical protein